MSAEDGARVSAPRPRVASFHSFSSVAVIRATMASRAGTRLGSSLPFSPGRPRFGSTASTRTVRPLASSFRAAMSNSDTTSEDRLPSVHTPMDRSCSLRVVHGACLADDGHLDLTWVLERLLDLLRYVPREARGLEIVDLIGLHDDPHLTTSLDRE